MAWDIRSTLIKACLFLALMQEQLIFLHDAILESVTCGNTQITAADLRVVIGKYGKVDPSTGVTYFQSQFDVSGQ